MKPNYDINYPPFDPYTPMTYDISDAEKERRGRYHVDTATKKGLKSSVAIDAFNKARNRGLADHQAYEYVRDVMVNKGMGQVGGTDIANISKPNFKPPKTTYNPNIPTPDKVELPGVAAERKQKRLEIAERAMSGLSSIGTGVALIPHPIAKGIGFFLQAPDLTYDTYKLLNTPSAYNGIDLSMDMPAKVFYKQIPGKVDDVMRGMSVGYDAYNAVMGKSPVEGLEDFIENHTGK